MTLNKSLRVTPGTQKGRGHKGHNGSPNENTAVKNKGRVARISTRKKYFLLLTKRASVLGFWVSN